MLADRGLYPHPVAKVIDAFEKTGLTVPLTSAVEKNRARFNLPPMKLPPADELRPLLAADDADAPSTTSRRERPAAKGAHRPRFS